MNAHDEMIVKSRDSGFVTPFQLGMLMAIEAQNFDLDMPEPPLWVKRDALKRNLFRQGVEYGYALHRLVLEDL